MNALELLQNLWKDLHDLRVLWQLLVFSVSVALAWWLGRLQLPQAAAPGGAAQQRADGLRSVRFPIAALILVLAGRWILAHFQSVSLLNLAVPLLVALVILRITFHILRLIVAPGTAMSVAARAISWGVWLGFALYVTGLAPDLLAFLDDAGIRLGGRRLSLLTFLQSLATIAVALLLSLWLGHVLEDRVMAADMNINLRVMLTKLMRPLLVIVAILIALPMVGVDLTALSVFGGAIGVGVGFGLQKIASNYISGFIILLDRSVKIGDFLSIEKHSGQLTKMTARYVVMRSADGTEVIIPNETVITSTVVNHSYSDKTVCVPITVQISYGSDIDVATRILVDAAMAHARVLRNPAPRVLISAFADNGIHLELGVWVKDPEDGRANLRSDIYHKVWKEFQAQGIVIPFPQREVRLLGAVAGELRTPPAQSRQD
jgi:small-conductance mechanosensitive channel